MGSTVPSFTLKDRNGELFSIDSVPGKKKLVVFPASPAEFYLAERRRKLGAQIVWRARVGKHVEEALRILQEI